MRNFLFIITVLFFLLGCSSPEKEETKPNIILILADDYGYMDSQGYARRLTGESKEKMFYETPHIDRLMNEGVSFTYAYANQLCSPTRASILTGKYAGKLGFTTATPLRNTYYNQGLEPPEGEYIHDVLVHKDPIEIEQAWINGKSNTALPAGTAYDNGWDEVTIAEALVDYHSAFIGKWHVGGHGAKGYQPADQGFHPIAYYDAGGSAYFNWRPAWNRKSKNPFPEMPQEEWEIGDAGEETSKEYLTDDLTVQALRYLDERAMNQDEPFSLYFCHFAVHTPIQAKKEDSIYFAEKNTIGWNGHNDPKYAGMIRGLDNSVGAILDKLAETGLEENTLVIFFSDNGGLDSRITFGDISTVNAPLRGGKACLTEGGIRVPLIFKWKGKINEGEWCDVSVDCTDLFPTILEAAGYDPEEAYDKMAIDGRSLMPLFKDPDNSENAYDHDTRYWHYPFNVRMRSPYDEEYLTPHSGIMEGDYKLIFDWHGRLYLYNVKEDVSETNNLIDEMPDKTRDLFDKLISWLEENIDRHYWPEENPDYNPEKEVRQDAPFVNLYEIYDNGGDVLEYVVN